MTLITQAQAAKLKCPIARTFDDGKSPTCDGGGCILWRWGPIKANDKRFTRAVKAKQTQLLANYEAANPDKSKRLESFLNQAVAEVAKEPWTFMEMTSKDRGWCGLGGKP